MKAIIFTCLIALAFSSNLRGEPVDINDLIADDSFNQITPQSLFGVTLTGLASWYRANNSQDSTNGVGWCGKEYTDATPAFAPPFKILSPTLATWQSNPKQWEIDTATWCGLEAKVTDPNTGKSMLLYIYDAFDPAWVRTEYAIDVMVDAFSQLNGNPNGNKDIVVQNMQWELTGNRINI